MSAVVKDILEVTDMVQKGSEVGDVQRRLRAVVNVWDLDVDRFTSTMEAKHMEDSTKEEIMLELDTERLEQLAKHPEATADASDQREAVFPVIATASSASLDGAVLYVKDHAA